MPLTLLPAPRVQRAIYTYVNAYKPRYLYILIETSLKMRMANNFESNDCVLCRGLGEPLVLCSERWIPVYQDTDIKTWKHFSLTQKIHEKNVLNFIRPDKINTLFWTFHKVIRRILMIPWKMYLVVEPWSKVRNISFKNKKFSLHLSEKNPIDNMKEKKTR